LPLCFTDSPFELDWVFLGTLKTSPIYPELEKIKTVRSFDDLLEMGDTDFINLGVENNDVRAKVLNAIRTWNDEHQLPGFPPTYFVIIKFLKSGRRFFLGGERINSKAL